jgi:hypothetical protein
VRPALCAIWWLRIKFLLFQEGLGVHQQRFSLALNPFIGLSHEDRFDRTGLFTESAEDASCRVEFIGEGISPTLLILGRFDIDALRRTDDHAEATGHTLCFSPLILLKILDSSPALCGRDLLLRILNRDGFREEPTKGQFQTFQQRYNHLLSLQRDDQSRDQDVDQG